MLRAASESCPRSNGEGGILQSRYKAAWVYMAGHIRRCFLGILKCLDADRSGLGMAYDSAISLEILLVFVTKKPSGIVKDVRFLIFV